MQSLTHPFVQGKLRLLTAGLVLAAAAGMSQTALAQPAPGGAEHGRGHGMAMHGGGQRMDRMLDAVNASPEQRAQIKQIVLAARTDLKAQHETRRALRSQSQAVFAQPNVDARAAESLRQQMSALRDQASKRMLQARLDVARVLTADQRKVLADRMAQRQSMMERHRAERDALGAPRR